jgi:hypothetical protein
LPLNEGLENPKVSSLPFAEKAQANIIITESVKNILNIHYYL